MYQCQLCVYSQTRSPSRRILVNHLRRVHGASYDNAMQWAARSEQVHTLDKSVVTAWDIVRAAVCVAIIAATLWILW